MDVPEGMVYVPGGTTHIGVFDDEVGMDHERPAFAAEVAPFFLDRSPVTVSRFRAFTQATGYETQAESFGDGAVMDTRTGAWALVPGADWRHPRGAGSPLAPDDHPVTQVSWNDAEAFCAWDGGRLPTEIEWEHAARGAVDDRSPYAWGDALDEGGELRANTWTGTFPEATTAAMASQARPAPSAASASRRSGSRTWAGRCGSGRIPGTGLMIEREAPFEPTPAAERVQRGGSFLCHPSYCHGFRVSARSHSTPESALFHTGFRCARDGRQELDLTG